MEPPQTSPQTTSPNSPRESCKVHHTSAFFRGCIRDSQSPTGLGEVVPHENGTCRTAPKRSGGHPRTHSGVTSTHRHKFASFFPPRVTRAHRLESRAHTAIFQSHPRTQTGVTSTILHHFFHAESPAHTSHGIGWGGAGWGGDDDILCTCTHVQSARNGPLRYILYTCPNLPLQCNPCSKCYGVDCFGTYFTHLSKPVM